jgi:hypothetical protein
LAPSLRHEKWDIIKSAQLDSQNTERAVAQRGYSMLGVLAKLFGRRTEPARAAGPASPVVVSTDETIIRVHQPDAPERTLTWEEITNVTVVAKVCSPSDTDFRWTIAGSRGHAPISVPFGASGEREFIRAMQGHLQGFDNMAVSEALSTSRDGSFPIWEAPPAKAAASHKTGIRSVS